MSSHAEQSPCIIALAFPCALHLPPAAIEVVEFFFIIEQEVPAAAAAAFISGVQCAAISAVQVPAFFSAEADAVVALPLEAQQPSPAFEADAAEAAAHLSPPAYAIEAAVQAVSANAMERNRSCFMTDLPDRWLEPVWLHEVVGLMIIG
ncbi:MAG: hypothetical protein ABIR01_12030 [Candidatus Eisenbacteria bacterium]